MNNCICNESVSENGEVNLFIFPCAGGTASSFHGWNKYLSDRINIYPVQYPMREKRARDAMPESIKLLAQELVEDCIDLIKNGKCAFLGDCSGSITAYEAAIYIEEKYGIVPQGVFAVSSPSPAVSNPMTFNGKFISELDSSEFVQFLKENMSFPEEFYANRFAVDYYRKIVHTDFKLVEEYDHKVDRAVECDIISFVGSCDKYMTEEHSADWKRFCSKSFKQIVFEGEHNIFETHQEQICKEIEELLLKQNQTN